MTPFLSDTTKPTADAQTTTRKHALSRSAQGTAAATSPPFTLVLPPDAGKDERGALTFAFGLEHQVTETYVFTLTTLTSPDVIRLVATIVTVVSGHAGILGSSAGLTTTALFPNGPLEGATVGDGSDGNLGFDPASFPVN